MKDIAWGRYEKKYTTGKTKQINSEESIKTATQGEIGGKIENPNMIII
ncbi:MAG: hypothetical protein Q8O02_00540 [Candidatus Omnitrophota bacterium]|nr:hypothetical protein [Candidatus Omnitrophota bacterium]